MHHRAEDGKLTFWDLGRYSVEGCPQRYVTPGALEIIGMWQRTKRYGLPFSGGWMEQPWVLIHYFDLLEAEDGVLMECMHDRERMMRDVDIR